MDEKDRHDDMTRFDDEQVRRRAYELYQSRGGTVGSELDDWLAAEREVRIRRQPAADTPGAPDAAAALGRDASQDSGSAAGDAMRAAEATPGLGDDTRDEARRDPLADAAGDAPGARDDASEGMASTARPRTRRNRSGGR